MTCKSTVLSILLCDSYSFSSIYRRNTSRRDSVAINWRALEFFYRDIDDQDKILDQAIDIVHETERYTDDNEYLRDSIETHLSDILVSGSAPIELGNHFLIIFV